MNQEMEQVLKLDNEKKYEYFIKKITDFEEVWSLKDEEGWASLGDNDKIYFPVWATKEYADLCISEEWEGYESGSIYLPDFIEKWLPGLKKDEIRITVMWHKGKGIDVDWDTLLEDIEAEMEEYEME